MAYKVDPIGARMASALFGTLTVPLLYAFAKRLFSSTLAAVASVLLLLSSGYFYVQSRIATPEIFVAFFALLTIYCMYRFWIASQIVKSRQGPIYPDGSRIVGSEVVFDHGERLLLRNAKLETDGQTTRWDADGARVEEGDNIIGWRADGTIAGSDGGRSRCRPPTVGVVAGHDVHRRGLRHLEQMERFLRSHRHLGHRAGRQPAAAAAVGARANRFPRRTTQTLCLGQRVRFPPAHLRRRHARHRDCDLSADLYPVLPDRRVEL